MKKKRLNKRQLVRIQESQDAHKVRTPESVHADTQHGVQATEREGLVISHFGQQLDIEALDGEDRGSIHRCFQRSNLAPLVTGDRVVWQQGDPLGVVVALHERSSLLQRPNKFNELKPVAANIDRMVIVIAPLPEAHANLVDRYLVAAEISGIRPLLLLNKSDLLDTGVHKPLVSLLALYEKLGYVTLRTSCHDRHGLAELEAQLRDHTSAFVGQSGVGKSALVNALLPDADIREGTLSQAVVKGRHTTTSARLYHLPLGGQLIDSPGIREFGLWHMDAAELLQGFTEFRPFLGACRFRDCQHLQESDCSLLQAAKKGLIDPRRLQSYQLIRNSMEIEFR